MEKEGKERKQKREQNYILHFRDGRGVERQYEMAEARKRDADADVWSVSSVSSVRSVRSVRMGKTWMDGA